MKSMASSCVWAGIDADCAIIEEMSNVGAGRPEYTSIMPISRQRLAAAEYTMNFMAAYLLSKPPNTYMMKNIATSLSSQNA